MCPWSDYTEGVKCRDLALVHRKDANPSHTHTPARHIPDAHTHDKIIKYIALSIYSYTQIAKYTTLWKVINNLNSYIDYMSPVGVVLLKL